MVNHQYNPENSSFTKFFAYHPEFDTIPLIEKLHKNSIEAMHLEHKTGSPYQAKFMDEETAHRKGLKQYLKIHDSVISLPLREEYSFDDFNEILALIK